MSVLPTEHTQWLEIALRLEVADSVTLETLRARPVNHRNRILLGTLGRAALGGGGLGLPSRHRQPLCRRGRLWLLGQGISHAVPAERVSRLLALQPRTRTLTLPPLLPLLLLLPFLLLDPPRWGRTPIPPPPTSVALMLLDTLLACAKCLVAKIFLPSMLLLLIQQPLGGAPVLLRPHGDSLA